MIPFIKSNLNLSDGALGLLLLGLPCGQLAGMCLSPRLIRRFGSAAIARLASFILPLLIFPISLAPPFALLFPVLFCFGFSMNLSNIAINTQCVQVERLYRKSIMISFHGVWSLGILICIFLNMVLTSLGLGQRGFALSAICLCQAVWYPAAFAMLPRELKTTMQAQKSPALPKRGFLAAFMNIDKRLLILGIGGFGCLAFESGIINWIAVFYTSELGIKSGWILLGYVCFMCSITFCRFSADHLVRRAGPGLVIALAGWLMLCGAFLITIKPGLLLTTLGCLIAGLGTAPVMPVIYSAAARISGIQPQSAIAVIASISFMGLLLGPPCIGLIAEASNLRLALAGAGCLGFAAARLMRLSRLKKTRPKHCKNNDFQAD